MNDISKMNITEHNKLDELVNSINKNIYNFHKIVHKLQQNYKSNKLSITKLTNDNKMTSEMLFNLDNNLNKKIENIQIELLIIKSKLKDIEEEDLKNKKIFTENMIFYFCANVLTTSIICFSFAKIF